MQPTRRRFARHTAAALAGLSVALAPPAVEAANHAVLVGVSNYENPNIEKLDAPGTDVRRMWDVLATFKFEPANMVALADDKEKLIGVPDDRRRHPTRANILKALDDLIQKLPLDPSGKKEFVVFYFSGHGTFHREATNKTSGAPREADGNDEVLLAIDAKNYSDTYANNGGGIEGGILDDEIRERMEALEKRAVVWMIVDSCHAGGTTRSALGEDVKYKAATPESLKAKVHTGPPPGNIEDKDQTGYIPKDSQARLIAFLAVQEEVKAIERKMVVPEFDDRIASVSVFTHFLIEALKKPDLGTFAEIADEVHSLIVRQNLSIPTPLFQGALRQSLPGETRTGWPLEWIEATGTLRIKGGTLEGLRKDSIVALLRAPRQGSSQTASETIGYARITVATPKEASGTLLDTLDGKPVPKPAGSVLAGTRARIHQAPVSFVLTVAKPPQLDCNPAIPSNRRTRANLAKVNPAIDILKQRSDKTQRDKERADGGYVIDFVDSGKPALVQLCVSGDILYLVGGDVRLAAKDRRPTPSHSLAGTPEQIANALYEDLWKIVRQQNLLKVAAETGKSELAQNVRIEVKLDRDEGIAKGAGDKERRKCTNFDASLNTNAASLKPTIGGKERPKPGAFTVFSNRITHCDRLIVEVFNEAGKDIDVTLLYLDSEGAIGAVGQRSEARIPKGRTQPHRFAIKIVTWCPTGQFDDCLKRMAQNPNDPALYAPIGTERLAVIIAEVAGPAERTYYHLQQDGLNKVRTRSARGADAFEELLSDSFLPGATRTRSIGPGGDGAVKVFQWEVMTPEQLGKRRE